MIIIKYQNMDNKSIRDWSCDQVTERFQRLLNNDLWESSTLYADHYDFLGAEKAARAASAFVDAFEKEFQPAEEPFNSYSNRDAFRQPCYRRKITELRARISTFVSDFHEKNQKWLTCTRAADAPDVFLAEEIERGNIAVWSDADLKALKSSGTSVEIYDTGVQHRMEYCGRDENVKVLAVNGEMYINGWGEFRRLFEFEQFVRLTDVHPHVADILVALDSKNGFTSYHTDRFDWTTKDKKWMYVRVQWTPNRLLVGSMNTDAFRPKKRGRRMRKFQELARETDRKARAEKLEFERAVEVEVQRIVEEGALQGKTFHDRESLKFRAKQRLRAYCDYDD